MPNENADVFTVAKFGDIDHFIRIFDVEYLNSKSEFGSGLLHYAISGRQFDIAMFLLDNGIDVNMQNIDGQTALHLICMEQTRNIDITREILQKGVNVNIQDKYGNPAIWTAAFNCKGRNYDTVQLLMSYNPDISIVNNVGLSALDIAIRSNDDVLLNILLRKTE